MTYRVADPGLAAEWAEAVHGQENFFESFGDHLPPGILAEHDDLAHRIGDMVTPAELHGRDAASTG